MDDGAVFNAKDFVPAHAPPPAVTVIFVEPPVAAPFTPLPAAPASLQLAAPQPSPALRRSDFSRRRPARYADFQIDFVLHKGPTLPALSGGEEIM